MALLLPCFDLAVPKLQSTRKDQKGELTCLFSEALLGLSVLLPWIFICLVANVVWSGFSHRVPITFSSVLFTISQIQVHNAAVKWNSWWHTSLSSAGSKGKEECEG